MATQLQDEIGCWRGRCRRLDQQALACSDPPEGRGRLGQRNCFALEAVKRGYESASAAKPVRFVP